MWIFPTIKFHLDHAGENLKIVWSTLVATHLTSHKKQNNQNETRLSNYFSIAVNCYEIGQNFQISEEDFQIRTFELVVPFLNKYYMNKQIWEHRCVLYGSDRKWHITNMEFNTKFNSLVWA